MAFDIEDFEALEDENVVGEESNDDIDFFIDLELEEYAMVGKKPIHRDMWDDFDQINEDEIPHSWDRDE